MSKVFIFDIDGTLTPSRQAMTKPFQEFFEKWIKTNPFYLVTGSDLSKVHEQMNFLDIEAQGIFTCCGNDMWIPDPHTVNTSANLEYSNKFKLPKNLIKYLELELRYSPYLPRCGNHIENRGAMVNFSVVGRDCSLENRLDYFKYDSKMGERKRIAGAIKRQFPKLDAALGGQISIDITPKGYNKSQILEHIKNRNIVTSKDEYIFIGDRTMEGGNDYPLAKLMEETENCSYYQTKSWEQTISLLKDNG